MRRSHHTELDHTNQLRFELEQLKTQQAHVAAAATGIDNADTGELSFDHMSATEQAAGSLGVDPNAWRPIKFMNAAHFDTLIKTNSLDEHLARRIEAFRTVASGC